MRRNVFHITFSVFLALMFIVYASGIAIEKHTCNSCDIITYSIFSGENDSCCMDTEAGACQMGDNAESCCFDPQTEQQQNPALNGEKCCTFDSFYLSVSDHYSPGQIRQVLSGSHQYISLLPDLLFQQNEISAADEINPQYNNTPYLLYSSSPQGIEFLIFTHQLKIDSEHETSLS